MFEKLVKDEYEYLTPAHPVRLIKVDDKVDDKVVQIQIYVNHQQRCQIFDYFPNKILGWKETAPHLLILKSLAAYQNHTLSIPPKKSSVKEQRTESVEKSAAVEKKIEASPSKIILDTDGLYQLVKKLCHATAPLYQLVNHSYFDSLEGPLNQEWQMFKQTHRELDEARLKIEFLLARLRQYEDKVKEIFNEFELNGEIQQFKDYQSRKIKNFVEKLERLKGSNLKQEQVQKIFSNQHHLDNANLPSLGKFLRTQAKTLMADAIASVDEITHARFDQLFSFSANPLRKQFVHAKSDLEKQLSTHAVRFLNSQSPIPRGQLEIIEGNDSTKNSTQEGWMDIMPYVNGQVFWGEGIGGNEGLNDVDQILSVYMNSDPTNFYLKKPHFKFYQMFIDMLQGKKGPLGIVGAILLGLPVGILGGVALIATTAIAMAVDLAVFILQAAIVLTLCLPCVAFGIVADFILQLFSFFSEKVEFSFLAQIALFNIPSPWLSQQIRAISLVRRLKQWLLEQYGYCKVVLATSETSNKPEALTCIVEEELSVRETSHPVIHPPNDNKEIILIKDPKSIILDKVKHHQAEGLFNVVATKFFTFAAIATFLHLKLKQVVYTLRELRKVTGRLFDIIRGGNAEKSLQKHRQDLINSLKIEVERRNQKIVDDFIAAMQKHDKPNSSSANDQQSSLSVDLQTAKSKNIKFFREWRWGEITPWNPREFENPLDFISDIGLGVVHQVVDPAFENNPGVATSAFVGSIGCFAALLFPTVGNAVSAQLINALQVLPTAIAKAFMGKSLEAGLSTIPTNIISVFLQWKLIYFGSEALGALYYGDIEWIKKLFENPEEITLSAGIFIGMGYGVGLLPTIPTDIFNSPDPNNPFLQGIMQYLKGIGSGFAHAFNIVVEESREVSHEAVSGPNSLELAFIGLKSTMLFYGLLAGNHPALIKPLEVDIENLVRKLCAEFKNAKTNSEEEAIIARMLSQNGIADINSSLANKITSQFRLLKNNKEPTKKPEEQPDSEFTIAQKELHDLIVLVHDMEILGMNVDVPSKTEEINSYRSNADGELVYDALFFAFEKHNQLARRAGLFHRQIDGQNLLHNFYNKYCYVGSSGLHKILFGILLFPITWLWRGFKYLIGTPSMRQQVKKSFSKDFAMFFQLIPDIFAPFLRSALKAILYAIRMFLGILVLPPLLTAIVGIAVVLTLGLILLPFAASYAMIVSIPEKSEETFVGKMQMYFETVREIKNSIWNNLLCNGLVNSYMKLVSLIGSTRGTGSFHRLNVLKAIGASSLYERLTSIADTNFENLASASSNLRQSLAKNSCDPAGNNEFTTTQGNSSAQILHALDKLPPENQKVLNAVKAYDEASINRWCGRSPKRAGQLEAISYQALMFSTQPLKDRLQPVLNELENDPKSELYTGLNNALQPELA